MPFNRNVERWNSSSDCLWKQVKEFVFVLMFESLHFLLFAFLIWIQWTFSQKKKFIKIYRVETGKKLLTNVFLYVEFHSTKEWLFLFCFADRENNSRICAFSSHHCLLLYMRAYCACVCVYVSLLIWKVNRWIIALAQCCYRKELERELARSRAWIVHTIP